MGDAGGAQGGDLLAGAAEDQRIARLQPDDTAAVRGLAHQDRIDLGLRNRVTTLALADRNAFRIAPAHGDDGIRHQRVVHDDVGLLQQALRAQRQKVLGSGTGADQPDEAGFLVAGVEQALRLAARRIRAPGLQMGSDRAGEEAGPEAAALDAAGNDAHDRVAEALGKAGEITGLARQHRLDARADVTGEHRADAGGGDGDGDRRAVDQSADIEVADLRPVDGIGRNAERPRSDDDGGVLRLLAAGGKDEGRAVEMGGSEGFSKDGAAGAGDRVPQDVLDLR